MELLPSLPADLVAAADPSARGAAPLLRPPDADGQAPPAVLPFELCLALLATPLPGGETWPATGKELPVMPLEIAAGDANAAAPDVLSPLPPPGVLDAALQAQLRLLEPPSSVATGAAAVTVPLLETKPSETALPLPAGGDGRAPADTRAPPTPAELEPMALAAAKPQTAALEAQETEVATAPAKGTLTPSWLEAFTHERRLQRPAPAALADARAAAASAATPAAQSAPSLVAAVPAAHASPAVQNGARHIELPQLQLPVVTGVESTTSAQPDWLPPATHGSATSVAASTAAVPGPPVDLRSPNGPEAFASRVQWLVDQQVGEAHIKLNPPALGAVDVKISLVDDKAYVQLTTATAAARDELSQSLPRLRELFTGSGLELGGASVHNGRDGHSAGHGYYAETSRSGWHPVEAFADGIDEPIAHLPRRSLSRIDVFA